MNRLRSAGRGERGDAGGHALELLIIAPVLLLFVLMMVAFGRSASAHSKVDAAAASAARAASQQYDPASAAAAGAAEAQKALLGAGVKCAATPTIEVDTSGFDAAAGQGGSVIVRIGCTVSLSDLAAPLLPGSVSIDGRAASPIDLLREGKAHP